MRISDWSSDVCSSDLRRRRAAAHHRRRDVGDPGDEAARRQLDLPFGDGAGVDAECLQRGLGQRWIDQPFPPFLDVGRLEGVEHRARGRFVECAAIADRSEEHTSELQSLMRISYAVFCLKKKNTTSRLTSDR